MANLNNTVNDLLKQMRETGGTAKGVVGEDAAFVICEMIYQMEGGILYHSYKYEVDPDKEGNIKRHSNGTLYIENLGRDTEIDILFVTPYRIFPLELKAYKAKEITLTDDAIDGCFKVDKSPVHQHEMHLRHLYPSIFSVIPNGETKYIVPIVVFVDECQIKDARSDWQKEYIKVTNLNNMEAMIKQYNTPLEYRLDLNAVARVLKDKCVEYKKFLPCRIIE
jgi:hypothetical protein